VNLDCVLVETHNRLLAKVLFQVADGILSEDEGRWGELRNLQVCVSQVGKLLYSLWASVAGAYLQEQIRVRSCYPIGVVPFRSLLLRGIDLVNQN
jgi:hypothetical protein